MKRVLARLVDAVVCYFVASALALVFSASLLLLNGAHFRIHLEGLIMPSSIMVFSVLSLFVAWLELWMFGTSLGKKMFGLVVVSKTTCTPCSRGALVLREILFGLFAVLPLVNVLFFLYGCGGEYYYFHDSFVGTKVVVAKRKQ